MNGAGVKVEVRKGNSSVTSTRTEYRSGNWVSRFAKTKLTVIKRLVPERRDGAVSIAIRLKPAKPLGAQVVNRRVPGREVVQ